MARYRKRDALELRVVNDVRGGGKRFTADIIAKRATGVEGYRMTLAFVEVEGSVSARGAESVFVDLEPAATRADVRRRADGLADRPEELVDLLERALGHRTEASET